MLTPFYTKPIEKHMAWGPLSGPLANRSGTPMRWNDSLIPTLRDDPLEAEIVSHRLMLRAGLIRKLAGGLYTFLPLGLKALRRVEQIVREEMDRAGALEILMPALQPRELWDQSRRYAVMGDVLYRLRDRQDREFILGPTHEEVVTDLAAHELSSYRQLPKILYQIQTKFRDEVRPRFGLIRAREFIMKDAYSFDVSAEDADMSYRKMYEAYQRIFQRCGLHVKIVEAETGAMGGRFSHEFMVPADAGEDVLMECAACGYAANRERAERGAVPSPRFNGAEKPAEVVATPGASTIEQVSAFFHCEPCQLIKTLLYQADSGEAVAVLIAGDRDVNEGKLARLWGASGIRLADARTIEAITGAAVGFAGPVGLSIPVYADQGLRGCAGAITGANRTDAHLIQVDLARDTQIAAYADLCVVRSGDPCPRCNAPLQEQRGIEVGHCFKLGTQYSDAFGMRPVQANGRRETAVMGCYGIGVTRMLQAIVEQHHDARGIGWPVAVAPYPVAILVLNPSHAPSVQVAEELTVGLAAQGVEAILDDRDERPGVKFADADLVGFPLRVVVSERSLAQHAVELRRRSGGPATLVPTGQAVSALVDHLRDAAASD